MRRLNNNLFKGLWRTQQRKHYSSINKEESFVNGTNANYVDSMYEAFLVDPSSVHASWRAYFQNVQDDIPAGSRVASVPSETVELKTPSNDIPSSHHASSTWERDVGYRLSLLIRNYQVRGHLEADLDPLGVTEKNVIPELNPEYFGFREEDLDKEYDLQGNKYISGFLSGLDGTVTVRKLVKMLRQTYCGKIGIEYMHIQDTDECNWIRERWETEVPFQFSNSERKLILDRLGWATDFEEFLAKKWATSKRFGLDGGEALVPGLKALIDRSSELGAESVIMGMPHRGRLSVLANVIRKPLADIFAEFGGAAAVEEGSGDVKYHLGTSCVRPTNTSSEEKLIHLSLLANPSHLEAVNPVVMGEARARQYSLGDSDGSKVVPILFHGDAAFAGQGIVYETMNFWELEGYKVGGTIHVVVNNQVGFTTDPKDARSSPYCTSVAKAVGAPIFHVNGDHPEEVTHCFQVAAEYRNKWKKDVVIDMVCYRRFGHNEMDQPMFTQPLLYKAIKKHPTTKKLYAKRLSDEGIVSAQEQKDLDVFRKGCLTQGYDAGKTGLSVAKPSDWLANNWSGFKSPSQMSRIRDTGVAQETLRELGLKMCQLPKGFTAHRNITKILEHRKKMFALENPAPLDWATCELLAYATLCNEGNHVRLSGQDCQRGTFSHRHAVLHDQNTNENYNVLSQLNKDQAEFHVFNSPLSEFGVLGYELGYSMETPNQLVLWEAQFGDFANSAQVTIDQFIASGETKWMCQSGLTLLLPHGYDGMGPEHSSCRIERYLQLVDSDPHVVGDPNTAIQRGNMQVVNCTTPANLFHLLRRQVHREFRKPLIVASPKFLLRHPKCISQLSDIDDVDSTSESLDCVKGTDKRFLAVIPEVDQAVSKNAKDVKRVLYCSGKIYYDLEQERTKRGITDVAIVRLEQLAPFPFTTISKIDLQYPNANPFWVQEEPFNAGAYGFAQLHFKTALKGKHIMYIGRPSAASTATGIGSVHVIEQKKVVDDAFDVQYRD